MDNVRFLTASRSQEQSLNGKIEWLRAAIANGSYRVPAEKIAEAMLCEHRLAELKQR
jgi:anti-sigma28 factor (negative regulator of flagellin synthesis)